jgi:hypothetical protein
MRWLKHTLATCLVIAAVAVALATAFSEHSDDYGAVPLPQGGAVELPAKTVTVFYEEPGTGANSIHEPTGLGSFRVTPADGGPPLPIRPTGGGSETEVMVQRSETIGELGAVAKIDVPEDGSYILSGRLTQLSASSSLTFGTSAGQAVLDRWRLLAGLIGGALLVSLIPVPRHRKRWGSEEDEPVGWSSDPTAPYARIEPPYSG